MSKPPSETSLAPGNIPTIKNAKNLFLISLILVATVGGLMQKYDFWIGLSLTEILLILLPTAVFIAKGKFAVRSVLRLNYPGVAGLLIGVVLGICVWPLALWIQTNLLSLFSSNSHGVLGAISEVGRENIANRLLVSGLLASICEETLFRGYLQTSFESKLGAKQSILWTATLFSVYHLVPTSMLAILPLALLMSWVCWEFNSIFPAMLVHFSNNFVAPYLFLRYEPSTLGWFYVTMLGCIFVAIFVLVMTTKLSVRSRLRGT